MKTLVIILIILLVLLLLVIVLSAIYRKWLKVITVDINDKKILSNHKLLLISDLHNFEHGKNNSRLLNIIKDENPEYVLIAGDLLNDNNSRFDKAAGLLAELNKLKASVIYVPGNHEIKYSEKYSKEWKEFKAFIYKLNIIYLDDSSYETEDIVFSGYTNKSWHYRKFKKLYNLTGKEMKGELKPYIGSKCSFLIAHHPDFFKAYKEWGADRIVSGHNHGGIIRLPFIGGLLSPQTFLGPKYTLGTYYLDDTSLTVSAGLSVHTIPLRLFNRPDVTVINLKKVN